MASTPRLARGGEAVPLSVDTLCVHGDTPDAVALVESVRAALLAAGVSIRSFAAAEGTTRRLVSSLLRNTQHERSHNQLGLKLPCRCFDSGPGQYVGELGGAAIRYPPTQAPASLNLEAIKTKVQEAIREHQGQESSPQPQIAPRRGAPRRGAVAHSYANLLSSVWRKSLTNFA